MKMIWFELDIDYHSIVSLAIKTRTLTGAERTKTIASNVEYFGEVSFDS